MPLLIVLSGGCASAVRQAPAPVTALPEAEPDPVADTVSQAPLTVAGDIQFTMSERKAKAPPTTDDSSSTALQPQKASMSGMTSSGVSMQHVHSPQ